MNSLTEYIIDYQINESLTEILDNDEVIDEGKIMNGIKKLWRLITKKNKKNKDKKQTISSNSDIDTSTNNSSNNDSKEGTKIKIAEYSLNKLNQAIKSEMKKTKDAVKNKDVKVLVATDKDRNQIAATLVYVDGEHSPIAQKEEKFKNYAHIYSLEILKEYQETGLGRKLIKSAKDKLLSLSTSQSKGFTIDVHESNSKEIYEKIGFKTPYKDKDKDINIMYAKYEEIDTDH